MKRFFAMRCIRRSAALGLTVYLSLFVLSPQADDETTAPTIKTEAEQQQAGKHCEWACERWTKLCNVDPRGVYKCRRTCAKFGEVCE